MNTVVSSNELLQVEFFQPSLRADFLDALENVTITVLLTEKCNLQCEHCLYACSPKKPGRYVSDEVLQQVGDALAKVQSCTPVLNLLGGEPTINLKEFERVIRWTQSLPRESFLLSMVTNGWWLHRVATLGKVARILAPLWGNDSVEDDNVRITVSNTPWHDRFRPENLIRMIATNDLSKVLRNMEEWYPAEDIAALPPLERAAINEMAIAAEAKKLAVQCRHSNEWNLIQMGRAEENGLGRCGHLCSPGDLSLTIWPDGTVRHICDGAGKFTFGHINQGIELIWALRAQFLESLHRRYPLARNSHNWFGSNIRCQKCRQYAGYWLNQERPKFYAKAA